jgi:O-antigen ligase
VLGAGLLLGRLAGVWSDARTGWVAGLAALALPALLCVLAAGALTHSFYANAQATSGVQIVAISALLLLTATLDGAPRGVLRILVRTVSVALVLLAATLGLVLAARAQAALMLVVVVVVLAVVALVRPALIPRRMSTSLGGAAIGGALAVVLALTTLPVWPRWLGDAESLSFARQLLWRDALELWGRHPLLGGGPGAFYDSSPIARSEPHLYAAHSSVLQVGSELAPGRPRGPGPSPDRHRGLERPGRPLDDRPPLRVPDRGAAGRYRARRRRRPSTPPGPGAGRIAHPGGRPGHLCADAPVVGAFRA